MNNISSISGFRSVGILVALVAAVTSMPFIVKADQCLTTHVKILHYYGAEGKDCNGERLYGVKVQQGGNYYYAELTVPMPCLRFRTNKTVAIHMCRDTHDWESVTFEGHVAGIHKIRKLPDRHWQPSGPGIFSLLPGSRSPFYYED